MPLPTPFPARLVQYYRTLDGGDPVAAGLCFAPGAHYLLPSRQGAPRVHHRGQYAIARALLDRGSMPIRHDLERCLAKEGDARSAAVVGTAVDTSLGRPVARFIVCVTWEASGLLSRFSAYAAPPATTPATAPATTAAATPATTPATTVAALPHPHTVVGSWSEAGDHVLEAYSAGSPVTTWFAALLPASGGVVLAQ